MATTKTTEKAPEAPKPAAEPEPRIVPVGGIVADTEVLGKDIDARMAALLKDHQRMGARPK